ncbi:MAG: hybrid sensor histidine kinase/response regulator [Magnetococcales bacterium]|nr:hybrid sensor histidine kinase/response regulator [Magnetococcales bacterium]
MMNPSEILESTEGGLLLVDDQPEQIDIIKSALEQHFVVKVAIQGKFVSQICRRGGIDLILLDVMMPGMSGYEICRQLKNNPETREIPVIFLTSRESQDEEAVGLKLGAVDYIRKPSSPSVVLSRCRNTIVHQRVKVALRQKNEELQQALQDSRQAIKIREDMERISRHDLKGPLATIIGYPELLLEADNLTAQQRTYIKSMERSGYTLLEMINRSLDLFKMENGTYTLQPGKIDLLAILERIVGDLGTHSGPKGVNVLIEDRAHPDTLVPCHVVGEKMLCYSLFYNLLLNAIEASCDHGTVGIHSTIHGGCGMIRITNPGEVPHAIREHFFDKYVTSGKEGGSGLGTYSAWLAVKTQGGRIELDMSRSGETSVIVTLPCST